MQQYNKKRTRRTINYRGVIAILLLLVLICSGIYFAFSAGSTTVSVSSLKKMDFSSNEAHYFGNDGYFYVRGNALYYTSFKSDNKGWSFPLNGMDFKICASPDMLVIYGDTVLQAANYSGEPLFPSLEFTGKILDVRCGKNFIAVLKTDIAGKNMIYLFNRAGERLDILNFDDSYALSFGFYQPGDSLWTLALNTSGPTPISTITTYDTGRAITGRIPIDSQLISGVYFDAASIYAAGTDNIMVFDKAGKEKLRFLAYGWEVLDFQLVASKPTFLLAARGDYPSEGGSIQARTVTIMPDNTVKQTDFRLPPSAIYACLSGEHISAFSPDTAYKQDQQGKLISTIPLGISVDKVEKLTSQILLHSGTSLYLYDL